MGGLAPGDRKSTRLNSSHVAISYAVFCLKKKKNVTGGFDFCFAIIPLSLPPFARASPLFLICLFFFFNDTATTEIYTLSLHDALPISPLATAFWPRAVPASPLAVAV